MDKTVYTQHHVLTPNFDLAAAAEWAAQQIAGAAGNYAVKNHNAADYITAERHGFRINSTASAAVKEDELRDALKSTTKALIDDLYAVHREGDGSNFLAFSEICPLTKRHTNHATGYAGNVIARVVVWEGGTQGLHLSVQVSTRSNRNAD